MEKSRIHLPLIAIALFGILAAPAASLGAKTMQAPDTLPGVEPAMLTASYWVALQNDANAVIMSPADI